jgi:Fe-S cluster biogenesis protein NfuA|tara:strand:+ start:292 stop:1179 length:888 start_codon:yes stop_codon:yes gene_type:complete
MSLYKIKGKCKKGDPIAIFNLNRPLGVNNSKKYNNIDDAEGVTLVQKLFYLPFVKSVTLNDLSIEIERFDILEWSDVLLEVEIQIEKYLNKNKREVNSESEQKKVPLSVYAESTPNPSVMKFVANKKLTDYSIEYKNIGQARGSIFVVELFNFSYVKEVFISENYISITKNDSTDWNNIVLELREFIVASLKINNVITSGYEPEKNKSNKKKIVRKKIEKKIISILEEYVKPAVSSDGGDIVFDSYQKENKNVNVILKGACSGCPSSTITLKNGIENILKDMLPGEINSVNAING